jgi:hypothetical protein
VAGYLRCLLRHDVACAADIMMHGMIWSFPVGDVLIFLTAARAAGVTLILADRSLAQKINIFIAENPEVARWNITAKAVTSLAEAFELAKVPGSGENLGTIRGLGSASLAWGLRPLYLGSCDPCAE